MDFDHGAISFNGLTLALELSCSGHLKLTSDEDWHDFHEASSCSPQLSIFQSFWAQNTLGHLLVDAPIPQTCEREANEHARPRHKAMNEWLCDLFTAKSTSKQWPCHSPLIIHARKSPPHCINSWQPHNTWIHPNPYTKRIWKEPWRCE